jgi:hypothetical protein
MTPRPEGARRTLPDGAVHAKRSMQSGEERLRTRRGCAPTARLVLYHGREYDVELEGRRGRLRGYWDRDTLAWRTAGVKVSVEAALRVREAPGHTGSGSTPSTWVDARLCYLPPRHADGPRWTHPLRRRAGGEEPRSA